MDDQNLKDLEREQADNQLIGDAFQHLLDTYLSSRHRKKVDIVTKAFNFARQAHKGVRRLSGEPYIMHPIAVAQIGGEALGRGSTSICAALLHDVVEDTDITFEDLEKAFKENIDYFMDKMILACEQVEQAHMDLLPTPFLSSVIKNCMDKGMDVTKGGAKYNLSGIQMIQIANLADSFAAIKQLVYDEGKVSKERLLKALQTNYKDDEILRTMLLNKVPKYGNDVEWVDELGAKWAGYFRERIGNFKNYRGGKYHTGMYTVSAHVPMGENVGASPDGHRLALCAQGMARCFRKHPQD